MVGIGEYPNLEVRWPGGHDSPLLYMMIPNIILFRPDHRVRSLVTRVDFVTTPGVSSPNVYRPGGPASLVTGMARFSFDRGQGRFRLESIHPGNTLEDILENTGFDFDYCKSIPETPSPDAQMLELIRDRVNEQIAELYPNFASQLLAGS